MQELLLKTCNMEEKKSGMKMPLNRVWYRTTALTGVSRSTAQKLWKRSRRHMTSSSLGPVVNILAIFSYANILKK